MRIQLKDAVESEDLACFEHEGKPRVALITSPKWWQPKQLRIYSHEGSLLNAFQLQVKSHHVLEVVDGSRLVLVNVDHCSGMERKYKTKVSQVLGGEIVLLGELLLSDGGYTQLEVQGCAGGMWLVSNSHFHQGQSQMVKIVLPFTIAADIKTRCSFIGLVAPHYDMVFWKDNDKQLVVTSAEGKEVLRTGPIGMPGCLLRTGQEQFTLIQASFRIPDQVVERVQIEGGKIVAVKQLQSRSVGLLQGRFIQRSPDGLAILDDCQGKAVVTARNLKKKVSQKLVKRQAVRLFRMGGECYWHLRRLVGSQLQFVSERDGGTLQDKENDKLAKVREMAQNFGTVIERIQCQDCDSPAIYFKEQYSRKHQYYSYACENCKQLRMHGVLHDLREVPILLCKAIAVYQEQHSLKQDHLSFFDRLATRIDELTEEAGARQQKFFQLVEGLHLQLVAQIKNYSLLGFWDQPGQLKQLVSLLESTVSEPNSQKFKMLVFSVLRMRQCSISEQSIQLPNFSHQLQSHLLNLKRLVKESINTKQEQYLPTLNQSGLYQKVVEQKWAKDEEDVEYLFKQWDELIPKARATAAAQQCHGKSSLGFSAQSLLVCDSCIKAADGHFSWDILQPGLLRQFVQRDLQSQFKQLLESIIKQAQIQLYVLTERAQKKPYEQSFNLQSCAAQLKAQCNKATPRFAESKSCSIQGLLAYQQEFTGEQVSVYSMIQFLNSLKGMKTTTHSSKEATVNRIQTLFGMLYDERSQAHVRQTYRLLRLIIRSRICSKLRLDLGLHVGQTYKLVKQPFSVFQFGKERVRCMHSLFQLNIVSQEKTVLKQPSHQMFSLFSSQTTAYYTGQNNLICQLKSGKKLHQLPSVGQVSADIVQAQADEQRLLLLARNHNRLYRIELPGCQTTFTGSTSTVEHQGWSVRIKGSSRLDSLDTPQSFAVVGEQVLIADTGNDRLILFGKGEEGRVLLKLEKPTGVVVEGNRLLVSQAALCLVTQYSYPDFAAKRVVYEGRRWSELGPFEQRSELQLPGQLFMDCFGGILVIQKPSHFSRRDLQMYRINTYSNKTSSLE